MTHHLAITPQTPSSGPVRGAQLLGLSAMALGQPLLDVMMRQPAFLVAHHASPLTIGLLVATLLIAPPLFLLSAESIAARLNRNAAHWLRFALTASLVALIALPVIKQADTASGIAMLAISIAIGVGAAIAYGRFHWVRRFATVLGVASILIAPLFWVSQPIAKLLRAPSALAGAQFDSAADLPPIVLVILDELPLTSLLDERERIDPVRYPAFAKLAETSTWFRGASAVHFDSIHAVPAILTGKYPSKGRLPTAADHPENLFTLLGSRYHVYADEPITAMYHRAETEANTIASMLAIASDLRVIYLHLLLPVEFTSGLPAVAEMWKGFTKNDNPLPTAENGQFHADRVQRFSDFTASLRRRIADKPTLYFLHSLLPHPPWEHLPSGRAYFPANAGVPTKTWGPSGWWPAQAYQQHLLQLSYTDTLLGKVLAKLERLDMFDAALIVVTSDHGAGFWPNGSHRGPELHPEDVLSVPLLIKAPHQRRPKISDRAVESIDILPSIADLLDIEIPWAIDGCSAFDVNCAARTERRLAGMSFPVDTPMLRDTLAHKLELFGSGTTTGSGLYSIGSRPELIGRAVREFERSSTVSIARVMRGPFALAAAQPDYYVTSRITGLVQGLRARSESEDIAIAVGGIIRAVVPALPFKDQGLLFSALIPEEFAPSNPAMLRIFAVDGTAEHTVLRLLRIRFEAFRPH